MYYGATFHCFCLYCKCTKMPKNGQLTYTEKQRIVTGFAEGLILLDLAKELGRNKIALFSYVDKHNTTPRIDKNTRSVIFHTDIRKKRRQGDRDQMSPVPTFFVKPVIDLMSRKTRCSVLNEMVRNVKLVFPPSLNQSHKKKLIL